MTTILPQAELVELTGYKLASKQKTVLDDLGIPYKEVSGRPIVLAEHVASWVEGRAIRQSVEPDFSMVR